MAQMKEQIKTSEKELNEVEISNVSDAEFKTLFTRMLKELSEDLSSIKKNQSETCLLYTSDAADDRYVV